MPRKGQIQPPIAFSENDQLQVLELYQQIQRSRAKLVGPNGRTQSLPVSLYEFLVKLIADLCRRSVGSHRAERCPANHSGSGPHTRCIATVSDWAT
jgi:hypothetical protein